VGYLRQAATERERAILGGVLRGTVRAARRRIAGGEGR
jgi:hypothetical protein